MALHRQFESVNPLNTNGSIFDVLDIHVPAWHADALCAQADPEAWFPEKGGSTREAKAICRRCPVQAECVDDALARGERFGIWGGLSERERRKITLLNPDWLTCLNDGCDRRFPNRAARSGHHSHCPYYFDTQEPA